MSAGVGKPGPCTEGLVQGHDAGEGREPVLPREDISARCVICELSPKEDINKGGFSHTMMGRHKSNDIKDFYFGKVQQNMHDCGIQCGYNEANDQGMTMPIAKVSLVEEINSLMSFGITSL